MEVMPHIDFPVVLSLPAATWARRMMVRPGCVYVRGIQTLLMRWTWRTAHTAVVHIAHDIKRPTGLPDSTVGESSGAAVHVMRSALEREVDVWVEVGWARLVTVHEHQHALGSQVGTEKES